MVVTGPHTCRYQKGKKKCFFFSLDDCICPLLILSYFSKNLIHPFYKCLVCLLHNSSAIVYHPSLSFFILFQIDRSGRIPMLRFRDRESYAGNKTKEYDDLAMKYLSYVLFLLVGCSSVYSLMYEQHKSWYSWILSSLTSCVYMFGKSL